MSRIHEIGIDIETLPAQDYETIEKIKEDTKPPKTIKKQETIDAWYEDKFEEEFFNNHKKTGLDSMKGEIYCLSAITTEKNKFSGATKTSNEEKTEKELLSDFEKWLLSFVKKGDRVIFIAHNGKKFDFQWIWRKAIKYKLFELAKFFPRERYSKDLIDTMEIWAGPEWNSYTSLDDIAKFLGVKGKMEGIDGSKVYDYYLQEEYEKIIEYCDDDANIVLDIYLLIKNGL